MKKIITLLLLAAAMYITTSCDKWLTIQPATSITGDQLFSSAGGFRDALMGVYIELRTPYNYNGPMVSGTIEHLACQWAVTRESKEHYMNIHEYYDDRVDTDMGNLFRDMYSVLANVNMLIDNLESQSGILKESEKNSYLAQALAIRAYVHFDLIRLWGPMPKKINPAKKYLPYALHAEIDPLEYITYREYMEKLQNDLDRAEELTSQRGFVQNQYFSYLPIRALQARVHQWLGNDNKAAQYAQMVIDEVEEYKAYNLSLANQQTMEGVEYTQFRCENILQLLINPSSTTSLASYVYRNYLNEELFEMSGSDLRLMQWKSQSNQGDIDPELGEKMVITKYDLKIDDEDGKDKTLGVPLIRLSEMYFILMECHSDMGIVNQMYAKYCTARNIPVIEFSNKAEVVDRLSLEFRREFFAEGQLFYFYKRHGVQSMPRCARGCGESAYVVPIPKKEFDLGN